MLLRPRNPQLADELRAHRVQIERELLDIAERGGPLSRDEARLAIERLDRRISSIEHELRRNVPSNRWLNPVRNYVRRFRGLFRPRVGQLRHYPPRPLILPARYGSVRPPGDPPSLSIVTPAYQQGRFIERTITSVVSQRYPALEYVVQDGGSTDETVGILERLDAQITRWTSEPDDGHADALTRAFHDTSGEVMGWLNSDDLLLPGALAYVAGYFAEHPEVDAIYGNRLIIDEHDRQVGAWVLPRHDDLALTLADFVPQETLFWRRRLWEATGCYCDNSFRYALDWELLLRFRAAGARIAHVRRFIGAFRVHETQRTSAEFELGLAEMSRLRERIYGRPVALEEVNRGLRPYLWRHVLAHNWQRLVDRLPVARIALNAGYPDVLERLQTTHPSDHPTGLQLPLPSSTAERPRPRW